MSECIHGYLDRQCPYCEIDRLTAELAEARKHESQTHKRLSAILGDDDALHVVAQRAVDELAEAQRSRDFYKTRIDLLQSRQHTMRDPERTLVCDIIANGLLLPDQDGRRYPAAIDDAGSD
jgi:hypothetical protein